MKHSASLAGGLGSLPLLALLLSACGAARAPLKAQMTHAVLSPPSKPVPLKQNHFRRDKIGGLSEAAVREILAAPVFLEEGARLGIVGVRGAYELNKELPLTEVTGALEDRLNDAKHFELCSEMTADWPGTRSIAGLRELAARYRTEYVLLYRHRFVDRSYTNGWGWGYMTLLGSLFVPSHTLEAAGVLEATLFDVKTGTLLFTVFERVHEEQDSNVWHNDIKVRKMKEAMLAKAAEGLGSQVIEQLGLLVAARPEPTEGAERVAARNLAAR